jgi:beta-galactosidase
VGWEVHPEALYDSLKAASKYKLPMLISENGIADHADHLRPDFLRAHFKQIERALREGLPVFGYLHWSLTDNFEWAQGLTPRFGLVEMDYKTLARRPRSSLGIYRKLIARFRKAHLMAP